MYRVFYGLPSLTAHAMLFFTVRKGLSITKLTLMRTKLVLTVKKGEAPFSIFISLRALLFYNFFSLLRFHPPIAVIWLLG
uniref:Uncharacterized protein n=1 Tax=Rhizophora mucronata TaxID=61149 RepID=A0A2P2Q4Q1_RHIMU